MKRAVCLLFSGWLILGSGCEKPAEPVTIQEEPAISDRQPAQRPVYTEPAHVQPQTYNSTATPPAQRDPVVMEDPGTTAVNNDQNLRAGGSRKSSSSSGGGGGGRTYTVKKGDSLSKIAAKYYGDGSKWQRIYNANRGRLKSPNDLRVGQKLTIP